MDTNIYIKIILISVLIVLLIRIIKLIYNYLNRIKKKGPKLPGFSYTLIYSDEKTGQDVDTGILKSDEYKIQGKPDYIYKKFNNLIPVELKSGSIKDRNKPYDGDLMQLVCYFIIIEEEYGIKPKIGRIIYKDYMFIIRNTRSLQNELINTIYAMEQMLVEGYGEVSPEYVKCRYCICRGTVCEHSNF